METVFGMGQGLFLIWGVGCVITCSLVGISAISHWIVRTHGEKKDEQHRQANRVSGRGYRRRAWRRIKGGLDIE